MDLILSFNWSGLGFGNLHISEFGCLPALVVLAVVCGVWVDIRQIFLEFAVLG